MLRESHKRLEALKGKDPSALLLSGGEITISPEATASEKASSAANFKSYMNVTTGQGKVYTKYASQSPQALGNAHGKLATMQSSLTTKQNEKRALKSVAKLSSVAFASTPGFQTI